MKYLALIALLVLVGCGEDDGGNRPTITPIPDTGNMTNNDMGSTTNGDAGDAGDTGDVDMGGDTMCAEVTCDAGEKCVKGDCVPTDAKLACEEVNDLGTLQVDAPTMFSGDTSDFVDTSNSSCGEGTTYTGPENAFRFELAAAALVTINLTSTAAVDWLVDVREACDGQSIRCSKTETFTFLAQAGKPYFLIVEPESGLGKGAFDVAMTFEPTICDPNQTECANGTLQACFGGTMQTPYDCAAECSGQTCQGQTCQDVIQVSASMSFSGDIKAYTNDLDFSGIASCSTNGAGVSTPGQDIVLELVGLTTGQVVTIDASMDSQDDSIAILNDCSDTPTCKAFVDLGDVLTWNVVEDGNQFVAIDRRIMEAGPFSFSIDIQ
ncbi:MAG: hypothetical protein R3E66_03955 [bacterium]